MKNKKHVLIAVAILAVVAIASFAKIITLKDGTKGTVLDKIAGK